ncbi:MAG: hypothetical protein WAU01_01500 [Saprospiraceae bacterium]
MGQHAPENNKPNPSKWVNMLQKSESIYILGGSASARMSAKNYTLI